MTVLCTLDHLLSVRPSVYQWDRIGLDRIKLFVCPCAHLGWTGCFFDEHIDCDWLGAYSHIAFKRVLRRRTLRGVSYPQVPVSQTLICQLHRPCFELALGVQMAGRHGFILMLNV